MQILDLASKERHRYPGIIDTDTLKHSRSEQLPGQCIFQYYYDDFKESPRKNNFPSLAATGSSSQSHFVDPYSIT